MKGTVIVLLTLFACCLAACKPGQKENKDMNEETRLKIETTAGDIIVKLYNETPKHRENFIKLCRNGDFGFLDRIAFYFPAELRKELYPVIRRLHLVIVVGYRLRECS